MPLAAENPCLALGYRRSSPQTTRHLGNAGENVQNAASQFIHLSISGVIMPRLLAVDQPVDASEHSKRAVDAFLGVYGRRNDL
ncbi:MULTISPECIES: TetR/AcrR family transcriptional regulator C-terminal domain-containing protein [Alphaproteobacteria]|uniref:TetR/AcrR family transcriptional regulator C-terminal domain-containing protein n=1 Tax=Alphaproteobacteria TaxID=28211 RepID=UPI003453405A